MSEKVTIKVERKTLHLPTIALRGLVVFPNNLVHFEVGREKSIAAVEWAMANNSNVFLVAQKSMDTTDPAQADLFTYGVVAEVKQVLRVSEDLVKVLVEGKYRAKLTELDASGDFLLSEVRPAPVRPGKPEEAADADPLLVADGDAELPRRGDDQKAAGGAGCAAAGAGHGDAVAAGHAAADGHAAGHAVRRGHAIRIQQGHGL